MAFMNYNRKKPFNKVKQEHIDKIKIHLKKIDELYIDKRQAGDSLL